MRTPIQLSSPLLESLFSNNEPLTDSEIKNILNLPREKTISDLESILHYVIDNYDAEGDMSLVVLHSVFLLTEMQAEQSLTVLLRLCKQPNDFLDFYVDDHSTETMWQDIMVLGKSNIQPLLEFVRDNDSDSVGVCIVTGGLAQMALHYPEKRSLIIAGFREILTVFYHTKPDYSFGYTNWLLSAVTEMCATELTATIKQFSDAGRLEYPTWTDFLNAVSQSEPAYMPLLSIRERYDNPSTPDIPLRNAMDEFAKMPLPNSQSEYDKVLDKSNQIQKLFEKKGMQPLSIPKPNGKNAPCPCGSGKKYKRCCAKDN